MRLVAQAKMGYYPTPECVIPIISRHFRRSRPGCIMILDPCAGEGTVLQLIGNYLEAETYGIELDFERGAIASSILDRCLITDYKNTKVSHNAFSLLWLNPPYDWAARDEIETCERYERTFLRDCIAYLCPEGILVYLIPQHRLDKHIAKLLAYRFENITVYRFPEGEYEYFKQIIVFGILKKTPSMDNSTAEHLIECGKMEISIPSISEIPQFVYDVPLSPTIAHFTFSGKEINPKELEHEMNQHGLFSHLKEITTPLLMTEKIQPIMPLRYGHLAQILACGLMNGIVRDKEGNHPLLVKGITTKNTIHSVEVTGDVEKHIETDCITITIHAFNSDGELLTIQ